MSDDLIYGIGAFSRLTRITVKGLRHYHEIGLLVPRAVDPTSGYRSYGPEQVDLARSIVALRELEFSLEQIGEMLATSVEDLDLISFLETQRDRVQAELGRQRRVRDKLDAAIATARRHTGDLGTLRDGIEQERVQAFLYAGLRMIGRYQEIGGTFGKVARRARSKIQGPATGLFHDDEYKEEGAEFQGGFPVSDIVRGPGIECRELPECDVLTVTYVGPYSGFSAPYQALWEAVRQGGAKPVGPVRERYEIGPGMIFKGDPESYRTIIQIPVQ